MAKQQSAGEEAILQVMAEIRRLVAAGELGPTDEVREAKSAEELKDLIRSAVRPNPQAEAILAIKAGIEAINHRLDRLESRLDVAELRGRVDEISRHLPGALSPGAPAAD